MNEQNNEQNWVEQIKNFAIPETTELEKQFLENNDFESLIVKDIQRARNLREDMQHTYDENAKTKMIEILDIATSKWKTNTTGSTPKAILDLHKQLKKLLNCKNLIHFKEFMTENTDAQILREKHTEISEWMNNYADRHKNSTCANLFKAHGNPCSSLENLKAIRSETVSNNKYTLGKIKRGIHNTFSSFSFFSSRNDSVNGYQNNLNNKDPDMNNDEENNHIFEI